MGLSPYDKKKRLKALKFSKKSIDIDQMIHLSTKKLYPIIEMLADNSKNNEHFLTRHQLDDAILAGNLIKQICKILEYAEFKISTRDADFALENFKVTLNDQGKIYVETPLLLQLIDLYNILEDTKDTIDEFYKSLETNSYVQTESGYSIRSEKKSFNPNRIVLRLTKPITKSSSSLGLLTKNFIVMPSTTSNDETFPFPLKVSRSEISASSEIGAKDSTKRVKSTGSLANEEISEVTDIFGAKRVVMRCICDLQNVSKFLSTERKDVATIVSKSLTDNQPTSTRRKSDSITKNYTSDKAKDSTEAEGDKECCCPECFAEFGSRANLQECDDDKVIIRIKGCNENEGDVQIVIRQCADCKEAEKPPPIFSDKSISPILVAKSQPKIDKGVKTKSSTIIKEVDSAVESSSLHNKDSQGSYVCSEEEEEEERIQKLSLRSSKSSSNSVKNIEHKFLQQSNREYLPKTPETVQERPTRLRQSPVQQQSRFECSRIRMFETANLCLETDTGQELVISITITPKEFEQKKLSLRDIFSENEPEFKQRSSIDSASKKLVSLREPFKESNYYVEDRVIPLERTKICSSVDFDVTTLQTRIRDKGIQHKNAQIVVQLRELGIDNLLRACRPAKCCRKAVLNEKMKKCLPYAPSLRSLPLDEEDVKIINESLRMSLQKVKNSTNLNKDFYANYNYYSIQPIKTIMYFVVEQTKNISLNRNDRVRQKLSYYINLVNDIEIKPSFIFDILYFGVENTSTKNLPEEGKTNCYKANMHGKHSADMKEGEIISKSSKLRKEKYNKYEEIPMLTGNIGQNCSFINSMNVQVAKSQVKVEKNQTQVCGQYEISRSSKPNDRGKTNVSRIPIYQGNNRPKSFNVENIKQKEQEVYDISLKSLPRESNILKEDTFRGLESQSSLFSDDNLSYKGKSDHRETYKQIEQVFPPSSKETSRYSVLSAYFTRTTKRKKKSFYLPRSKSDMSLKILKDQHQHRAKSTQTKNVLKEIKNDKYNQGNHDKNVSSTNTVISSQNSSKVILNYFSKMLYKMIVKQTFHEQKLENMLRNNNNQGNCSKTRDKSLYELYKRFSNKNNGSNYLSKKPAVTLSQSTHPNLQAKKSQSRFLIGIKNSTNKICIVNNLAIQTSVLFNDSKQCQTSKCLLAYFIKPKIKPEENYLQKKRVFKKTYNSEALSGIANSCDQLEKFIVIFRSEHSLKSNLSNNTGLLSSVSERSGRSFDFSSEQIMSKSLIRLKETLEKYETVKNEITYGSLHKANINPIEYFVYQMCACNRVNKKPSLMKKILSKSKALFSSAEKDACTKFSNQREFFNMPSTDQRLCHQCGCLISKCGGKMSFEKDYSFSSGVCQCPPDNKPKLLPDGPCCKSYKKTTSNLSKITNASFSSVKSLKTYFKKSLSNIKVRSKEKGLSACSCGKPKMITKNVETICIPPDISVVPCTKKDTSTGTTKDSATQKCECLKCDNFADDGSCCCSHCLGCLDKSFDVKPDNNNIATLCKCLDESLENNSSKDNGDVTDLDMSVHLIKTTNKPKNPDSAEGVEGISKTVNPNLTSKGNNNANSVANTNTSEDKTSSFEQAFSNKNLNSATAQPSENQQHEDPIDTGNNNDDESRNPNHDTTSYYLLTSPPNVFNQFGLRSRNPFEQYLLNFPHINMFRLDNSQTFFNE